MQPGLLHQVIQTCGLEECGALVALATPRQLEGVFDLDLWRASGPGQDEQFDPARFGVWLEVLVDVDPSVAARTLAGLDVSLVTTALAQYARAFHLASVHDAYTTDDEVVEDEVEADEVAFTHDIAGFRFVATRTDSWDAIVAILTALSDEHPRHFQRLLSGWVELSNDGYELDGLDDLLSGRDQTSFDVSLSRERRRERQGYATPDQARAFLTMSRQLQRGAGTSPPVNAVSLAYFRAMERDSADETEVEPDSADASPGTALIAPPSLDGFVQVIAEAGILPEAPRALLDRPQAQASRLALMQTHMQFVRDTNYIAYSTRSQELAYLVNALVAGGSFQDRSFTVQEASDASVAICNLGLENWPTHWPPVHSRGRQPSSTRPPLPENFLLTNDLAGVFQVGWSVLYEQVCMHSAQKLVRVLTKIRCDDRETQKGLNALRIEMATQLKAGKPWLARYALDVVTTLDMPAWATLLGLIDECPVIHAALSARQGSGVKTVGASTFEFISENRQIAAAHAFMESLPDTLSAM